MKGATDSPADPSLFLCPTRIAPPAVLETLSPGSPARVAVQVDLCEHTACDEREALRLIDDHPAIAAWGAGGDDCARIAMLAHAALPQTVSSARLGWSPSRATTETATGQRRGRARGFAASGRPSQGALAERKKQSRHLEGLGDLKRCSLAQA
jgi:hypothetical protein